jgi:hypothetical protein
MPNRFRVEYFSSLRGGEKVRSVRRKGHVARIAVPHGKRVKGSGRLIEVLHPIHENPCRLPNPAELVVMMANPTGELETASRNYEEFHGRPAQHIDTYQEPEPRPVTTSEVGELIDFQVKRPTGWKWAQIDFTARHVKVARNVEGTQLYLIGGNQKVSRGELTHVGADNSKELIDLGEAMTIAYRAKREEVNGISSPYEHRFGEITGVRPRLMYDTRGPQPRLSLVGGEYRVTEKGIEN